MNFFGNMTKPLSTSSSSSISASTESSGSKSTNSTVRETNENENSNVSNNISGSTNFNLIRFDPRDKFSMLNSIQKLGNDNTNVHSWIKQIYSWMELFQEYNMTTVTLCMKIASYGEVPEYIDAYLNSLNGREPVLNEIENYLLKEWLGEKSQPQLFEDVKNMSLKRNETIKEFNKRFKKALTKLGEDHRKLITVIDYKQAIKGRNVVWAGVHTARCTTLEAAYEEAELYDEVHNENIKRKGSYYRDSHQEESSSSNTFNKLSPKKIIPQNSRSNLKKDIKEDPVDELTTRMKNLRIKTCYICSQEGHLQYDCPRLKRINELLDKLENIAEEKN